MKSLSVAIVCAALAITGQAVAKDRQIVVKSDAAEVFAKVPAGIFFPEGITANPANRDIYVGTFDFGNATSVPPRPANNQLLRFNKKGKLVEQRDFNGTPLLGLAFKSGNGGEVYIANVGLSKIQRIAANFGPATAIEDVATIPSIGAPGNRTEVNPDGDATTASTDTIIFGSNGFPAPNALVFDSDGNLLFSDSFQGAIFRVPLICLASPPCEAEEVVHDALLATAGHPPFGANGLALGPDSTLFVANTGDDRILRVNLTTGVVSVFAESINGADGIAFDDRGRLWVAANQGDHLVALNPNGRVVAQLGAFLGIKNGRAKGLLFPASIVIVRDDIFVTNLALPLTGATGDEPEEDVTRYTVSRIEIDGDDFDDDDFGDYQESAFETHDDPPTADKPDNGTKPADQAVTHDDDGRSKGSSKPPGVVSYDISGIYLLQDSTGAADDEREEDGKRKTKSRK